MFLKSLSILILSITNILEVEARSKKKANPATTKPKETTSPAEATEEENKVEYVILRNYPTIPLEKEKAASSKQEETKTEKSTDEPDGKTEAVKENDGKTPEIKPVEQSKPNPSVAQPATNNKPTGSNKPKGPGCTDQRKKTK